MRRLVDGVEIRSERDGVALLETAPVTTLRITVRRQPKGTEVYLPAAVVEEIIAAWLGTDPECSTESLKVFGITLA